MKQVDRISSSAVTLRKAISSLLALFVICTLYLTGCDRPQPEQSNPTETLPHDTIVADSYDDVFNAIDAISQKQERFRNKLYGGSAPDAVMEDAISNEAAPLVDSGATSGGGDDYSATNVQVEGVDEGDIVKTDGKNIYMVSGSDIVIAHADGDNTEEVARVTIDGKTVMKEMLGDYPAYPQELYVDGDVLAVLYQYNPNALATDSAASSDITYPYPGFYKNVTEVACFDISDARNPKYLSSFGQDGYYSSSRLHDGILYLISNYTIYDTSDIEREEPITYIPLSYTGSESTLIAPRDICILPDYTSITYAIITSLDLESNKRIDQQSILGSSNTIYMSTDNLYLAEGFNEEVEQNAYKDGSFTVTEYQNVYSTRIAKLSLDKGAIEFITDTTVHGSLLNQFSMDEFDGHLRIVTTIDTYRYRIIEDEKGKVDDYQSYESEPSTNALTVLDGQLRTVGAIDGLAEDERVYSVRFNGPVGYFVTFKQIDPLFAVDLSNPTDPVIKSELKIPGFSTYMHPYSENRLFGLGMAADENGRTRGLKMSMFDTSDPYDITEARVLHLGESSSAALYDHKAIFIDQERDIIGFQTDIGYVIYGYSDDEGFYLRQKFDNGIDQNTYFGYYTFNDRGLYIGSYFYLCGISKIGVYELDTFKEVKQVPIEVSGSADYTIQPLSSGSGMTE